MYVFKGGFYMSILDKAKGISKGILDVAVKSEVTGQTGVLIYRHPNEALVSGSIIRVYESQEALFLKDGVIQAILPPGPHTVDSQVMPFLSSLMNLPFGGKKAYAAEVWFVNKSVQFDIPWGTPSKMLVTDPATSVPLSVSANGTISIKVIDSRNLFVNMVGQVPNFTLDNLKTKTKSIVIARTREVLQKYANESGKSFIDISGSTSEIGDLMREAIHNEFERYGLSLEGCYFRDIVVDKDENYEAVFSRAKRLLNADTAALEDERQDERERRRLEKMGATYMQDRQMDVMQTFAGNENSAGTAAVGLGAGVGMMGMVAGQMQNMMQPNIQQGYTPPGAPQFQQPGAPAAAQSTPCPQCNAAVQGSPKFCPECGGAMGKSCGECGATIEGSPKFCPECGASTVKKCGSCNAVIEGTPKFCPECGDKV